MSSSFTPTASHLRSLRKYRNKAKFYDSTVGPTNSIRSDTIHDLQLKVGDVVLDVGCGSGVSFKPLLERIGPTGVIFGFDQSAEMLKLAESKCLTHAWSNVRLENGFAETVKFSKPLDALLFHYTHDILQSPLAVQNLLTQARPGARVAIAGMKNFPLWTGPLLLLSFLKNYAWNGNPRGLTKPWRHAQLHLENFKLQSTQWGMGYRASGRVRSVPKVAFDTNMNEGTP